MAYGKSISDGVAIVGGIMSLGAGIKGSVTGQFSDAETVGKFIWDRLKFKPAAGGVSVFNTVQKFMSKPFTKLKHIADDTVVAFRTAFKQLANKKSVKFAKELGDNLKDFVEHIDSSIDFVDNWPGVCHGKNFPCDKNVLEVVDNFGEYCGIM